ncbi:SOUL family heme-binding protein [Natronorubrum aibiense]|uniref:Heme-binding protein n=1 Tax=Natronorubrum aibiense TaxID=348826 RepID=A0A5P9P0X6_9EURY|nr:heme-binding protein [Natronorubrum aibiense]QFU81490.1 heme-binding protein [Natronorubrum aibiense]
MRTRVTAIVSVLVGLLAAWIGWGLYVIRTTDRVPFETLERDGAFEQRRYPATMLIETTAPDRRTAFRRLFQYISGENEAGDAVSMTAPVTTSAESVPPETPVQTNGEDGTSIPMTAPVRTDRTTDVVSMAFYLPPEYTLESAPVPTDPAVRLVTEPSRTVAVWRFSWYATDRRVERARQSLRDRLEERGLEARDELTVLQYNDPWTPPFLRRNEVAVTVDY